MKTGAAWVVLAALVCACAHTRQPLVSSAAGRVIRVSDEYNYVVYRNNSAYPVEKNDTLFVQRENEIIGEIRVFQQTNDLGIANIMRNWSKSIAVGDRVVSPALP